MRPLALIFAASLWGFPADLCAQSPPPASAPQQPNYQPGWPCTGKERSFDPAYAKVAEATGGHLFLFDRAETAGWGVMELGDRRHPVPVVRAVGKIDSYVDVPVWVDSSIESLFVVVSLQCMQTVYLYDPQRAGVDAKSEGVEDNWYRAGRMSTIAKPQPGSWVVRLLGTGPYSVAVEAKSPVTLGAVKRKGNTISLSLDPAISDPVFRLVNAAGEPIQPLALARDPDSPSRYTGTFEPPAVNFRVQAEWRGANGEVVWRTDPRLMQPAAVVPASSPVK